MFKALKEISTVEGLEVFLLALSAHFFSLILKVSQSFFIGASPVEIKGLFQSKIYFSSHLFHSFTILVFLHFLKLIL